MQKFIEQLQSLEEPRKTKVLIVTVVVIMAIVIYFWLGYFNSIVSSGAQPAAADANEPTAIADNQPGFFTRMGNGLATVGRAFTGFFEGPSKYMIKPN